MCVALIGGMDRLERNYIKEAERMGIDLKVYTKSETSIASKVRNVDAVVIFTNKVSHKAKKEVMSVARAKNIPVYMYHSCGICTLRDCLRCLNDEKVALQPKKNLHLGGAGLGGLKGDEKDIWQ